MDSSRNSHQPAVLTMAAAPPSLEDLTPDQESALIEADARREWDEAVASMAICEEATIVFSAGASARMQMPFIGARKAPPRTANPNPSPNPSPSPNPNPSPSPTPRPGGENAQKVDQVLLPTRELSARHPLGQIALRVACGLVAW